MNCLLRDIPHPREGRSALLVELPATHFAPILLDTPPLVPYLRILWKRASEALKRWSQE